MIKVLVPVATSAWFVVPIPAGWRHVLGLLGAFAGGIECVVLVRDWRAAVKQGGDDFASVAASADVGGEGIERAIV